MRLYFVWHPEGGPACFEAGSQEEAWEDAVQAALECFGTEPTEIFEISEEADRELAFLSMIGQDITLDLGRSVAADYPV